MKICCYYILFCCNGVLDLKSDYEKLYLTLSHAGHETSLKTKPWGAGVRDIYIIHYVVSGSGYFEIDGQKHKITSGQSFLIVPNIPVYYYPDPLDPWEYVWVNFYGAQAAKLLSQCSLSEKNPVTAPKDDFPIEIVLELVETYNDLSNGAVCRNEALLHLLLSWYVKSFPADERTNENESINLAVKIAYDNFYKKHFSVEKWAEMLNINRATLYRQFENIFKITPKKYLIELRLQKACELLESTDFPIKTIAFSVGFDDQLSFSKFFKSQLGLSPTRYRDSKK